MSKLRSSRIAAAAAALGLLSVSTIAVGLPWDIDMADSQAVDAYAERMRTLPEGIVSQDDIMSPAKYQANYVRGTEGSERDLAPNATPTSIELGATMYQTYCYPCHGDQGGAGGELGPVAWTEAAPARLKGIPYLAGPNGVSKDRTDHWIYFTIRNGGGNMPSYGHAMNKEEMWSIVHYMRTLPNAMRVAPAPADEEAP